jgi:hypothetical protein
MIVGWNSTDVVQPKARVCIIFQDLEGQHAALNVLLLHQNVCLMLNSSHSGSHQWRSGCQFNLVNSTEQHVTSQHDIS